MTARSQETPVMQISETPRSQQTESDKENFRHKNLQKKSRIRETLNLSTDADSRTDTILRGYVIFLIIFFYLKKNKITQSLKKKIL